MAQRNNVSCYLIAIIFGIVFWVCWMALCLGCVTFNCDCFAVDSEGNLYIGRRDTDHNTIFVYCNGKLIRNMRAISSRGYAFTIRPDDTMIWSDASDIVVTDLYCNEISRSNDELSSTYHRLVNNKVFEAQDGTVYKKKLSFGTFSIWKDDTLIYEHPAYNQIILIIIVVSGVILLVDVLWIFKRTGDGSKPLKRGCSTWDGSQDTQDR